MGDLYDKWKESVITVYDSEELSTLELLDDITNFNGDIAKGVDDLNKKIDIKLLDKTDINGDHKGSWQGLDRPTLSEEGMRSTVEKLDSNYNNINTQLEEKASKSEARLRNIKLNQTDMADEFLQQIVGNAPINAVPAKGSLTKDRFKPKAIGVNQTDFIKIGKNLFDKDNLTQGYMISTNGSLTENTNYSVSDYILVEPNTQYYFNLPPIYAWYDESFNFISRVYQVKGEATSPQNALYLRVSIDVGSSRNLQVEKGTQTPKEDFLFSIPSLKLDENNFKKKTISIESLKEVVVGKNLFDKSKAITQGNVSPTSGGISTLAENLIYRVSDYIEVEEGQIYSKNTNCSFAFYDKFKTFISVVYDGTVYGNAVNSFPVPSGAKYIRLAPHWYDLGIFQFEKNSKPTNYEKFGYTIDKLIIKNENLPIKYPSPAIVSEEKYRVQASTKSVSYVDDKGVIWATTSSNIVQSSEDGRNFVNVFDTTPYLNAGETISLHALYVSDTGRIICATNQGRTLVSDEARTTMVEAFKFKAGITYINRGHCKYGKYIFMSSYGTKGTSNPPREVYMSSDHGATWKLIFDKPIDKMVDYLDYHVHDVAFDPYSNMILVSIGDGVNRQIHYSYDFGVTWNDLFDESLYSASNWAPIHPTCILCFPDGIAFGSDELPEGVSWWNRPKGVLNPQMKWEDISWVKTFGGKTGLIGTYAMKGDTLHTKEGFYGVMPFRNHNTTTEGFPRLFATGDGGRSWHEVFKETIWSADYLGFMNALLKEENGRIYIYAIYSQLGSVYIFKAEMPRFYEV